MFSLARIKKPSICNVSANFNTIVSWPSPMSTSTLSMSKSVATLRNHTERSAKTHITNLFLRPPRSRCPSLLNYKNLNLNLIKHRSLDNFTSSKNSRIFNCNSSSGNNSWKSVWKLKVDKYVARYSSIVGAFSNHHHSSSSIFYYPSDNCRRVGSINYFSIRNYSDRADVRLKVSGRGSNAKGNKSSKSSSGDQSTQAGPTKKPFSTSNPYHGRGGGGDRKPKSNEPTGLSHLFVPVPLKPLSEGHSVGAELTGKLNKADVLKVLNKFFRRSEIKLLSLEHGLDNYLFHQAFISFRKMCLEADNLPTEVHIVFSDVVAGAGHVDDLFPYFIQHAKHIFPHLECMDDLKKISDLRSPANWYPEARLNKRKIIFHAGPTNSGKTYHALERFMNSSSGVYCGPLKLLASEVYQKANDKGTPCDLVTGEERRIANPDLVTPSRHVACTVEMTSVNQRYECAVIDEIQMLRDPQRGWAWTRALLGVVAEEVHLCGEPAAIELVKSILVTTGEEAEVREYKRLTTLEVENKALVTLKNVQPGDCIVCFSKNDIYSVSRKIESTGKEVAVIYGGLPPGTKLAQAQKFNDPDHPCKVLVATDAIGMGLNLSIRRVIFYSLTKPSMNEKGEREVATVSTSQTLQIAGRAGRYGTHFSQGYVTCFKKDDLLTLQRIMGETPDNLVQAGLHPTADQIEMYAYHLPNATLSNLMDIFVNLCTVDDSLYFMCNVGDFKYLADMIQHIALPLRARYVFCCAPINRRMPFVCAMFLKFARQYSKNEAITFDWLCHHIGWPFNAPETIANLVELEAVFDVLDLYLWLSYRFPDLFPDAGLVRDTQKELDGIIQMGVFNITRLLKNSEKIEVNNDVA